MLIFAWAMTKIKFRDYNAASLTFRMVTMTLIVLIPVVIRGRQIKLN